MTMQENEKLFDEWFEITYPGFDGSDEMHEVLTSIARQAWNQASLVMIDDCQKTMERIKKVGVNVPRR